MIGKILLQHSQIWRQVGSSRDLTGRGEMAASEGSWTARRFPPPSPSWPLSHWNTAVGVRTSPCLAGQCSGPLSSPEAPWHSCPSLTLSTFTGSYRREMLIISTLPSASEAQGNLNSGGNHQPPATVAGKGRQRRSRSGLEHWQGGRDTDTRIYQWSIWDAHWLARSLFKGSALTTCHRKLMDTGSRTVPASKWWAEMGARDSWGSGKGLPAVLEMISVTRLHFRARLASGGIQAWPKSIKN